MYRHLALHAERFGLSIVAPETFDVERRRNGKKFRICFRDGEPITDKDIKRTVKALVIPPAWTDVRICIEAAGTDAKRKRAVAAAMQSVSRVLRNTPTVARSSYVHPQIVQAFEERKLPPDLLKGRRRDGLTRVETGLMRFLEQTAR